MLRTLKIGLLGGVLFGLSANASFAYDVASDFSITHNPNGVWSYGYNDLSGAFHLDTDNGPNPFGPDIEQWRGDVPPGGNGGDGNPSVFKNVGTRFDLVPAGTVGFHPGSGGQNAVIRFTAPTTGVYKVSSLFDNYGGGGTDVHIYENGVEIFSQNAPPNAMYSNAGLSLVAGTKLDFTVGNGGNGFNSDTTGLALDITAIPEPAYYQATALLGLGGIGLLRLRRRKIA